MTQLELVTNIEKFERESTALRESLLLLLGELDSTIRHITNVRREYWRQIEGETDAMIKEMDAKDKSARPV